MSLLQALTSRMQSAKIYVDDVFSAYTYTGTGATQTITNGIDLAGKGGLVWTKKRSGAFSHYLYDTIRGTNASLNTDDNSANDAGANELTAFNSDGFALGSSSNTNQTSSTYVSWTFRKAPKFFDVGTFTTGTDTNRRISHSLGIAPGLILAKATDGAGGTWYVYHQARGRGKFLQLELAGAETTLSNVWGSADPTTSDFGVDEYQMWAAGRQIVWYAFAHDTTTDGIIQCGSFLANASSVTTTLNWEPQLIMFKRSDSTGNWRTLDSSRGWPATGNPQELNPNLSAAETSNGGLNLTAAGFINIINDGGTYIYLAIRRPNKPPTTGAQVYNANAYTGNGYHGPILSVGFPVDLAFLRDRDGGSKTAFVNRLCDGRQLITNSTSSEGTYSVVDPEFDNMTGFRPTATHYTGNSSILYGFRRAPGFFDVVCYTGTGVARTVPHGLGVAPELWIVKGRSGATAWRVGCTALTNTDYLVLDSTAASATDATSWNSTYPTSFVFSLGTQANVNTTSATYVAYLFATLPGISKVGSYTGNGASQTINCGFTTGARFILIKRTDSTGGWFVWDSVRGIVAGNDPHLSLNTTAAEVTTDDSIDPDTSGFIVNQVAATDINVNTATYIFLSLA